MVRTMRAEKLKIDCESPGFDNYVLISNVHLI